ncbi:hypothetical protein AVEN_100680-1, partial [Araneus ventricosus]
FSSIFKAKPQMSRIHEMDRINSSGFARTQNGIKGGSTVHISRTSLWFNPETTSGIFLKPLHLTSNLISS